jgi:glycosyltransferase involved in cell wall biosynthesis
VTQILLGKPDLSIVLRPFNRRDGEYLRSRHVESIPNGIPDPCPDFDKTLLSQRQSMTAARLSRWSKFGGNSDTDGPGSVFRVLYLSLCRPEKGIFDLLNAIAAANAALRETGLRVELTVAGEFWSARDQADFEQRLESPDLRRDTALVRYVGFARGEAKDRLLRESDCLCLPTYLPEGFPLTFVEALAYGLPVITTNFRQLPEVLPPGYPGVVDPKAPDQLSAKLIEFARRDYDPGLRAHYLENFTVQQFAQRLRQVFLAV